MSYMKDLDEYTEAELEQELAARARRRKYGRCDYCGRHPLTRPCRFPKRHYDLRIPNRGEFACNGVFRKFADYSLRPQDRYDKDGSINADHTECNICRTHGTLEQDGEHHDTILTEPVDVG